MAKKKRTDAERRAYHRELDESAERTIRKLQERIAYHRAKLAEERAPKDSA